MTVDSVITLKNDKKYGLLLESDDLDGYFLAVLLNDKEEPTNNYAILKEEEIDGKTYVQRVEDPIILSQLLEDFKAQSANLNE